MASEMERNEPRKFSPVCSRSLKSRSGTTMSVELKEIRKGHFWEQCLKGNKKCPEQEDGERISIGLSTFFHEWGIVKITP